VLTIIFITVLWKFQKFVTLIYLKFNFVNIFIPLAPPPPPSQTINVALIAGVSGGVGGGVLVVSSSSTIILVCCCCMKVDKRKDESELKERA